MIQASRLYLPREWSDDSERLKAARVPEDVAFATKPQIARRMITRAIAAKVLLSFIAADSVYGTGDVETLLRKAGKGFVLGVASNHVPFLGQEATCQQHRRQDRESPSQERLAPPVVR